MTSTNPTKAEAAPVGKLRMIARCANALLLLIGYALYFCMTFIWHLILELGTHKNIKYSFDDGGHNNDGISPYGPEITPYSENSYEDYIWNAYLFERHRDSGSEQQ